jgi:hypothetical protein
MGTLSEVKVIQLVKWGILYTNQVVEYVGVGKKGVLKLMEAGLPSLIEQSTQWHVIQISGRFLKK